jgi:hypothetical protein
MAVTDRDHNWPGDPDVIVPVKHAAVTGIKRQRLDIHSAVFLRRTKG